MPLCKTKRFAIALNDKQYKYMLMLSLLFKVLHSFQLKLQILNLIWAVEMNHTTNIKNYTFQSLSVTQGNKLN